MNTNNGWLDIASAPKTGRTLLLGYWNSRGKWRTVRGQWMSADYIEQNWDDPDGADPGWFETSDEADDVPNCWPVTPSHWQPTPAAPGSPAETPAYTVTVDPDPRGVSVGVYLGSRCVYHGAHEVPAPAAGDALDAARYRWLRHEDREDKHQDDGAIYARQVQFTSGVMTGSAVLAGENLDSAIDAALSASQQGGE